MIKHILTTNCMNKCSYCISKNIHIEEYHGLDYIEKLVAIYFQYYKLHKTITFTGGEPTLANHLYDCWDAARIVFDEVFITSANPAILCEPKSAFRFNAITFSLHTLHHIPKVENGATVYASIMSNKFNLEIPYKLKELNYSGLTINENHFLDDFSDPFIETFLRSCTGYKKSWSYDSGFDTIYNLHGFTIKVNRRGECFKQNTVYIMPDLTTRTSFEEFL
jgi:MoaA/NifB/PqqE/SkfB family radical SAM enzyme